MPRETFDAITESQIKKASIATLADRPNSVSRYGDSNLSAQELKERFDAFPYLVQKKINEIIEALASASASKYITLDAHSTGKDNLYDFIALFSRDASEGKTIADFIYALYTAEKAASPASKSISEIFNDIASRLAALESARVALQESVSNHEERISSNESGISNHEERISANETNITNHEERISANETNITNHEERISGIERYLGGDHFIVDDSIAYQKAVPKNSCEKAKILSVGGMSYKSKNLLPYPYQNTTKSESGITFTDNGDGSISVKGTATENAVFYLYTNNRAFPNGITAGSTVTLSAGKTTASAEAIFCFNVYDVAGTIWNGSVSNTQGLKNTYTIPDNAKGAQIYIVVLKGTTANCVVYPQIEKGTMGTYYAPFFEGIRHARVDNIESVGANLIPYPYQNTTKSESGITFTDNGNGSISVKGTATENAVFYLYDNRKECPFVKQGEYYSRNMTSVNYGVYFIVNYYRKGSADDLSYSEWIVGTTAQTPTDFEGCIMYLVVLSGTTVDTTVTPMLNHGSVSLPYKPYVGTLGTITIPTEAQVSNGINEECYDYLDFVRKKIVKNVGVVDLGALNFSVYASDANRTIFVTSITGILPNTDSNKIAALLVDGYRSVSWSVTWVAGDIAQAPQQTNVSSVYVIETPNMSMDEFMSKINGKKLYYCLAAPDVIDVSSANLPDPYIEVEGGGTIVAVNEHNFAAPSSIKYLVTYPKEV